MERDKVQDSCSVFYIDGEVFNFASNNMVIERLSDAQAKRITYPFPSALGRNYNVLGAG